MSIDITQEQIRDLSAFARVATPMYWAQCREQYAPIIVRLCAEVIARRQAEAEVAEFTADLKQMEPNTVDVSDFDDSREAIYEESPLPDPRAGTTLANELVSPEERELLLLDGLDPDRVLSL